MLGPSRRKKEFSPPPSLGDSQTDKHVPCREILNTSADLIYRLHVTRINKLSLELFHQI